MPESSGQQIFSPDSKLVRDIAASPNFNDRRDGANADMVILHYTGMASASAALDWLCNKSAEVSSHYFIDQEGTITQLVLEKKRAWHAGLSYWKGESDINSHSIGIELVNTGHEFGYVDFPEMQMQAVVGLLGDIVERNNILPANILAHSDIAPLRKQDPGERFDWQMLYKAGLGIWVEPAAIDRSRGLTTGDSGEKVRDYQERLSGHGFGIDITGEFDELTSACTTAFQRHFRQQKIDGIADYSTVDTLKRLLEIF